MTTHDATIDWSRTVLLTIAGDSLHDIPHPCQQDMTNAQTAQLPRPDRTKSAVMHPRSQILLQETDGRGQLVNAPIRTFLHMYGLTKNVAGV